MFNDRLSDEAAKEHIQQRVKEVEGYSQQKRLGFKDRINATGVIAITVVLAVVIGLLF